MLKHIQVAISGTQVNQSIAEMRRHPGSPAAPDEASRLSIHSTTVVDLNFCFDLPMNFRHV